MLRIITSFKVVSVAIAIFVFSIIPISLMAQPKPKNPAVKARVPGVKAVNPAANPLAPHPAGPHPGIAGRRVVGPRPGVAGRPAFPAPAPYGKAWVWVEPTEGHWEMVGAAPSAAYEWHAAHWDAAANVWVAGGWAAPAAAVVAAPVKPAPALYKDPALSMPGISPEEFAQPKGKSIVPKKLSPKAKHLPN